MLTRFQSHVSSRNSHRITTSKQKFSQSPKKDFRVMLVAELTHNYKLKTKVFTISKKAILDKGLNFFS